MRKADIRTASRVTLYIIFAVLCVFLQCGVMSHFKIFGATPNLALCAIVCIAMFEAPKRACVLAVALGFFLECIGGGDIMYSPVTFLVAAALGYLFSSRITGRRPLSALFAGGIAIAIDTALSSAIVLFRSDAGLFKILFAEFLPIFLYSAAALAVIYPAVYLISRIFGPHEASVTGY